ncbi:MAG TPA: bifunctional phosphoribosylaminoimidazolecarboxamide formyltransferase/IMP cyclohydrolase, partial [Candidatus Kapabacteria bacterium]|nr:bifunctional phosphoribosylaminoimidazolecarboxamide formyltransferase/IMP cyclohydrolase [Candidatus Kapabacteria bacterium]
MSEQTQSEKKVTLDRVPIRRALISVFDKRGLDTLAPALAARGVELYSTGGTEKYLRSLGLSVVSISEFTNSPEIFDGRLKTLHPMVHGGLLFRRTVPKQLEEANANGILPIDLLVVNLYPFEQTVSRPGATEAEIIEQIDIGGPAMLRSAAKNFEAVALLTDPSQYSLFLDELDTVDGTTRLILRKELAKQAFERVAHYDRAIADYFQYTPSNGAAHPSERLEISLPLLQTLRYGENPHQSAALYGEDFPKICTQLWGKELSYNNILDTSSALGLIAEFLPPDTKRPLAGIFKHTNPCGVAEGANLLDAFNRAFETDPESPFGGIIIVNTKLDAVLAERLNQFFSEVILAPEYEEAALAVLKKKKDRRLLTYSPQQLKKSLATMRELRSVVG